jgi:hypothetical protein
MDAVLAQALLVAALIAGVLLVAVVYMVTKAVFGGKADERYVFESDGPQADRAYKAGH